LLKEMLRNNTLASNQAATSTPPMYLSRQAARALAIRHAPMSEEDLQLVYRFLENPDIETKMDGLKALRGLNAPQAVPHILPLLADKNQHVQRDACRTLAVLGDKSTVPSIEPLLKNSNTEVVQDAQAAIAVLQNK
jgi:HEAT repeat protein